jgi:glycosyltransferase involved in cell wall biosynthesis
VICDEHTVHVSYCYNPFRYAWNDRDRTLAERPDPISRAVLRALFRRWRQWDWIAAQRVDRYISISQATRERIAAYFGRDSRVVYPPVDTRRFSPGPVGDHYLVLSELMPHKRIEMAVRAFNKLGLPLVIAGDGPEARRLRRLAGPSIKFAGRVSDPEAAHLLSSCRALVVPAIEEFGIAAVEAQAAGRPVLAMRAGGIQETVIEGVTGSFWDGDADALAQAVVDFDDAAIDPGECVRSAARFRLEEFRTALPREVDAAVAAARTDERHSRRAARAHGRDTRRGLSRRLV